LNQQANQTQRTVASRSRRKAILIADMLREAGVPQARIDSIRTPVGLDLGGRTPAEIALSILAEITKERYART